MSTHDVTGVPCPTCGEELVVLPEDLGKDSAIFNEDTGLLELWVVHVAVCIGEDCSHSQFLDLDHGMSQLQTSEITEDAYPSSLRDGWVTYIPYIP